MCLLFVPQENVDKITFYPGLSGGDIPSGTLSAVKVHTFICFQQKRHQSAQ